ncbi:hypothetical protein SALBM135S_00705 [Streptomyces alboniger]
MRYRPLKSGLLVEGNSDAPYLKHLIKRQLDELILTEGRQAALVLDCEVPYGVRTTGAQSVTVLDDAWELAQDCHLLFVHADDDARDKAEKLVRQLEERRERAGRAAVPVRLVPVLMTEAWMLADWSALQSVATGAEPAGYPYRNPSDVERRVPLGGGRRPLGPKEVWRALLGDEAHEILSEDCASLLVRRTDLNVLARVPSYRLWVEETRAALRTLRFL